MGKRIKSPAERLLARQPDIGKPYSVEHVPVRDEGEPELVIARDEEGRVSGVRVETGLGQAPKAENEKLLGNPKLRR